MNLNPVNKKYTTRLPNIDDLIINILFLLGAIPFGQIFKLSLGGIILNSFELLYLSLIFLLLIRLLIKGRLYKFYSFFLFIGLVIVYVIGSNYFRDITYHKSLIQLRFYLPFFLAGLILIVGTEIERIRYLRVILYASIISSATSLIIHYIYPEIFVKSFSASEELIEIYTIHGRLYWKNVLLLFFVIYIKFGGVENLSIKPFVINSAVVLNLLAAFSTLNRTLMIGVVIFVLFTIYNSDTSRAMLIKSWEYFRWSLGILISIMLVANIDKRLYHLIELRLFGDGHGLEKVYENAVLLGRVNNYEQYVASISNYFPFGQGLGQCFSINANLVDIYTSDISLISFLLPFGIFGIIILVIFIRRLFHLINDIRFPLNRKERYSLNLLLIVSLLMSLNIDLFSRDNFIIFFSFLVMTLKNSQKSLFNLH